jgi:hypothetical protein
LTSFREKCFEISEFRCRNRNRNWNYDFEDNRNRNRNSDFEIEIATKSKFWRNQNGISSEWNFVGNSTLSKVNNLNRNQNRSIDILTKFWQNFVVISISSKVKKKDPTENTVSGIPLLYSLWMHYSHIKFNLKFPRIKQGLRSLFYNYILGGKVLRCSQPYTTEFLYLTIFNYC